MLAYSITRKETTMDIQNIEIPTMSDDDTYIGEDGLKYCSKCHTLRETKEIIPYYNRRMPVWCQCMREASELAEKRQQEEKLQMQVDKLKKASLLGGRYENATFENSRAGSPSYNEAVKRCRRYCTIADRALDEGYGIYLYGASGVGKTHLTACMCNELIRQRKQCLFTSFIEISKAIKATFGSKNAEAEKLIRLVSNVQFLFIDDFGTEIVRKNGEDNWLQEQIYDVINKRYGNLMPTIFSSNYTYNQLISERGLMPKTVERVREMSTVTLFIDGENFRKSNKTTPPF